MELRILNGGRFGESLQVVEDLVKVGDAVSDYEVVFLLSSFSLLFLCFCYFLVVMEYGEGEGSVNGG